MIIYLDQPSKCKICDSPSQKVLSSHNVLVGPGTELGHNVYLANGVTIGLDAYIGDHVGIGRGTYIGPRAHIACGTRIGQETSIGIDAMLGAGLIIGNFVTIGSGWKIREQYDLVVIDNIGSRNAPLSACRHKGTIHVATGCFSGTVKEFIKAVKATHGNGPHAKAYLRAVKYIKSCLTK